MLVLLGALLDLLVFVLEGRIGPQVGLDLRTALLFEFLDLGVHLVDNLEKLCLEFLVYLDHTLHGVGVGLGPRRMDGLLLERSLVLN